MTVAKQFTQKLTASKTRHI